jgi:hypothetical protein
MGLRPAASVSQEVVRYGQYSQQAPSRDACVPSRCQGTVRTTARAQQQQQRVVVVRACGTRALGAVQRTGPVMVCW